MSGVLLRVWDGKHQGSKSPLSALACQHVNGAKPSKAISWKPNLSLTSWMSQQASTRKTSSTRAHGVQRGRRPRASRYSAHPSALPHSLVTCCCCYRPCKASLKNYQSLSRLIREGTTGYGDLFFRLRLHDDTTLDSRLTTHEAGHDCRRAS